LRNEAVPPMWGSHACASAAPRPDPRKIGRMASGRAHDRERAALRASRSSNDARFERSVGHDRRGRPRRSAHYQSARRCPALSTMTRARDCQITRRTGYLPPSCTPRTQGSARGSTRTMLPVTLISPHGAPDRAALDQARNGFAGGWAGSAISGAAAARGPGALGRSSPARRRRAARAPARRSSPGGRASAASWRRRATRAGTPRGPGPRPPRRRR
jgi:hypothetical protein